MNANRQYFSETKIFAYFSSEKEKEPRIYYILLFHGFVKLDYLNFAKSFITPDRLLEVIIRVT